MTNRLEEKDKILEEMGIISDKSLYHPNRYWCNNTQSHLTISSATKISEVMSMVVNQSFSIGHEEGMKKRSTQIMELLNNEDL